MKMTLLSEYKLSTFLLWGRIIGSVCRRCFAEIGPLFGPNPEQLFIDLLMNSQFITYGIESFFPFPAGNGFWTQHHSAHTEMFGHDQEMRAYFSSQRKHAGRWKVSTVAACLSFFYNKLVITLCKKSGERFEALLRFSCVSDDDLSGIRVFWLRLLLRTRT